jgi:ppGpp synthetase/RelA/SpoT-type nucleotidyltranferase
MQSNDEYLSEFESKRSLYERLVEEVIFTTKAAVDSSGIDGTTITGRVKTNESLRQKLSRKQYSSPNDQVEDLAGIRIVCLFQQDVDALSKLLDGTFSVLSTEDKREILGSDRMGYQGVHKIVKLGSDFGGTRYDSIADLKCEVQIRTIVQDTWALINHHLVYKSEASTPVPIQRSINKVASLLEIAQEIFDSVRHRQLEYRAEIRDKESVPSEFLAQPINHDTVVEYTTWKFPNLPVSEGVTQRIVADLDKGRYRSLRDIDLAIDAAANAVEAYATENPSFFKFGSDRITKGLGFVDMEFRKKHRFAAVTRDAFRRLEHLVTNK